MLLSITYSSDHTILKQLIFPSAKATKVATLQLAYVTMKSQAYNKPGSSGVVLGVREGGVGVEIDARAKRVAENFD